MASIQQVRGSGVRLTLPYVLRFTGLWVVLSIVVVLVFAVTSYIALFDRLSDAGRQRLVLVLSLQTFFVVVAVIALAIFTTHRLAGPLIAMRRAFEDVRDGKLDRSLRFRRSDPHLGEVEAAFNEMMISVRQQVAQGSKPPAAG